MKREGRQHGMVRAYDLIPPPLNPNRNPAARIINKLDSPPTAGLFTRVSTKPTNHSKFTGKCEKVRCSGCHCHPVSKSKDKRKGTQTLKSSDAALNYRQISWRVIGSNLNPVSGGYSASRVLDELASYCDDNDDYDCDSDDMMGDQIMDVHLVQVGVVVDDDVDDGDDGYMGFYDVAVMWDPVDEDEGWSVIGGGI